MVRTAEPADEIAMADFKLAIMCDDLVEISFDSFLTAITKDYVKRQALTLECFRGIVAQSELFPAPWFSTRLA